jgi:hypothetical protein
VLFRSTFAIGVEFMLRLVGVVDQWQAIQRYLPEGWGDARLQLTIPDLGDCDRAAALLAPVGPGRRGKVISFSTSRSGAGPSPEVIRRLLARLDREGIDGRLVLVAASEAERAALPVEAQRFVPAWDELLAALPDDWSDLYAEVELLSSDYLERAALLMAPLNPGRYGGKPGFRFRVARRFGYGASPEMARRCLHRVDEEGARGAVSILRVLSDTRPVQTQGPVWYVGGHVV